MIAISIPSAVFTSILTYRAYLASRRVEVNSLAATAELLSLQLEEKIVSAASLTTAIAQTTEWAALSANNCNEHLSEILAKNPEDAAILVYAKKKPLCAAKRERLLAADDFIRNIDLNSIRAQGVKINFYAAGQDKAYIWAAKHVENAPLDVTIFVIIDDSLIQDILHRYEAGPGRFSAIVSKDHALLILSSEQARQMHSRILQDANWFSEDIKTATINDENFVYAAKPLASAEAYIVAAQPARFVFASSKNQLYLAAFTSALMLLTSMAAIWWGLDRLVLRWLSHYAAVTSAYARGDHSARMTDAAGTGMPLEIIQVAHSFNDMADRVAARTRDLEEEIARKQTYVRELHHRVKNILQMIASMLALEAREIEGEESVVISRASRRVAALGATYAIFYGYSERGKVPLATVISEAIARLGAGAPAGAVDCEVDGDTDRAVDLDTAIAIAMLLSEIISAYLEQNLSGSVLVAAHLADALEVKISASNRPEIPPLADRFIQAYAHQLNAHISAESSATWLRIDFSSLTKVD